MYHKIYENRLKAINEWLKTANVLAEMERSAAVAAYEKAKVEKK